MAQFYLNFDLENICTPVNWKILEEFLVESAYPADLTAWLASSKASIFAMMV